MRRHEFLKRYCIAFLLASAVAASRAEAASAEQFSMLQLLPERTRHLLYMNSLSHTWSASSNRREAGPASLVDAWREFGQRFGVPANLLAEHEVSGILQAEVAGPDGMADQLMIARTPGAEPAAMLLDAAVRAAGPIAHIETVPVESTRGARLRWKNPAGETRAVWLVAIDRFLISATDPQIAAEVIQIADETDRWNPSRVPGLTEILAARQVEWREDRPGLMWYSNPWLGADETSASGGAESPRLASARRHGLTGVQAVGGFVTAGPAGGLLGQTRILVKAPLSGSLRILQLTPGDGWDAASWLCRDFDQLVLLHGDLPQAFEYIGSVFDDLYADGIAGTYQAVLEDLKEENGLNIDLKTALYAHLGPRVLLLKHRSADDSPDSAAPITYAFQTSRPEQVARAVQTLMADDPGARPVDLPGCEYPLWRIASGGTGPDSGMIVARGFLVYAEDVEPLRQALAAEPAPTVSLAAAARSVRERIPPLGEREACMLWLRNSAATETGAASPDALTLESRILTLFFNGPSAWLDDQDAPRGDFADAIERFAPILQTFDAGLGFLEEPGWSLFTRSE